MSRIALFEAVSGRIGMRWCVLRTTSDSILQLSQDRVDLVACCVVRLDKGAVVGDHHGDIRELAVAELDIAVARLGINRRP